MQETNQEQSAHKPRQPNLSVEVETVYKRISDYGAIGNLHTVAAIAQDGSIDWLCLPYLDSPSMFAALLDDAKGGRFWVCPAAEFHSTARYRPETNILETRFRTSAGEMTLVDFMPIPCGGDLELEEARHELYRLIEVTSGRVDVRVVFEPRFDYARAETRLQRAGIGLVVAQGGSEKVVLAASGELEVKAERAEATWGMEASQRAWLHLTYGDGVREQPDPAAAQEQLERTEAYWRQWLKRGETGCSIDLGPYGEMANRSALILKMLYYEPTGTIAAAATTSLPERVGGVRNWDYRFTWLRDTSFTLRALFDLGHLSETEGYLRWLENLTSAEDVSRLQIMYRLRGETDLTELELDHLDGYRGSRPVRIGNGAAHQRQLDIYGEIMDAALKLSDYVGKIDAGLWPFFRQVCDYVVEHWTEPDSGIWEIRDGPHCFVHSKVMCWVALDRGLTIARRYGFPADVKTWRRAAEAIKAEVLDKGFSTDKQAFVQRYDDEALDSAALLLPLVGFLPIDDPQVASTIAAVERELGSECFLYRYTAEDGLPGGEGSFLLCTFWLIECMIARGELDRAAELLRKVEGAANHLGIFAEEFDLVSRQPLGNFPQALTHIGYINSVVALSRAKARASPPPKPARSRVLLSRRVVLNEGRSDSPISPQEVSAELKRAVNLLRGAFFDVRRGRVAYEQMKDSEVYQRYVEVSRSLGRLDLGRLGSRADQLAFWINLYNVIVIHGVVELGIVDSVKEVRSFFRRIVYRVGDLQFTPDDIEHGVLRGNRRPPNSLFAPFKAGDPRLRYVIDPMDARIHFALVCASSSCPPIELYTAEGLERELTVSAQTFLNGGGLVIDREAKRLELSRIFHWYGKDFGPTAADRLRFLAPYLYDPTDRELLEEHAESLQVSYQDYDWRLNRY